MRFVRQRETSFGMLYVLTGARKDWTNATRAREGGFYFNFLIRTMKKGEGEEDGKGLLPRRKKEITSVIGKRGSY